jgi:hypothetical protein
MLEGEDVNPKRLVRNAKNAETFGSYWSAGRVWQVVSLWAGWENDVYLGLAPAKTIVKFRSREGGDAGTKKLITPRRGSMKRCRK